MTRRVNGPRSLRRSAGMDASEYRREILRLTRSLDRLDVETVRRTVAALEAAQSTVRDILLSLPDGSPSKVIYERAAAGIAQTLDDMSRTLTGLLGESTVAAYETGIRVGVGPLEAMFNGVSSAVPGYQATIAANLLPELIGGITSEAAKRIGLEISSVQIGAKTPLQAAEAIGRNLTSRNHFSTIGHRARAIVVTENGRAASIGGQYAQQELARQVADDPALEVTVLKRWVNSHLPGSRATHLAAEARYAPGGTVGPIPVDATYTINGVEALYPHDPSLPASESVSCKCQSRTYIPEIME